MNGTTLQETQSHHPIINSSTMIMDQSKYLSGSPRQSIQYYISQEKYNEDREDYLEKERETLSHKENCVFCKRLEIKQEELKDCIDELKKHIQLEQNQTSNNTYWKISKSLLIFCWIFLIVLEVFLVCFAFFHRRCNFLLIN